ncbi:MAG TPA: acylphosphatase [Actinomycetota bacterium]|nr:acylphosphatase [Actinomycetota bacterium]
MSDDKVRAHVWLTGRVQGVFFRQEAYERAVKNQITGWIKNLDDGRVEVVLEGAGVPVRAMMGWLHIGPPQARVEDVTVEWEEVVGEVGFRVK